MFENGSYLRRKRRFKTSHKESPFVSPEAISTESGRKRGAAKTTRKQFDSLSPVTVVAESNQATSNEESQKTEEARYYPLASLQRFGGFPFNQPTYPPYQSTEMELKAMGHSESPVTCDWSPGGERTSGCEYDAQAVSFSMQFIIQICYLFKISSFHPPLQNLQPDEQIKVQTYAPPILPTFPQMSNSSDARFWTSRQFPATSTQSLDWSTIYPRSPGGMYGSQSPSQCSQPSAWVDGAGLIDRTYLMMSSHFRSSAVQMQQHLNQQHPYHPHHEQQQQQQPDQQPIPGWFNIGYGATVTTSYNTTSHDSSTSLASTSPDSNLLTTQGAPIAAPEPPPLPLRGPDYAPTRPYTYSGGDGGGG